MFTVAMGRMRVQCKQRVEGAHSSGTGELHLLPLRRDKGIPTPTPKFCFNSEPGDKYDNLNKTHLKNKIGQGDLDTVVHVCGAWGHSFLFLNTVNIDGTDKTQAGTTHTCSR